MLSEKNYKEFERILTEEKYARDNDRYYGLLFSSDKMEGFLRDKFFAVLETKRGIKSVIFDIENECEVFCKFDPQYKPVNFVEFKQITGDKWKYPNYYHPQKTNNWIVFLSGDMHL